LEVFAEGVGRALGLARLFRSINWKVPELFIFLGVKIGKRGFLGVERRVF
jgi:hypothetical protein